MFFAKRTRGEAQGPYLQPPKGTWPNSEAHVDFSHRELPSRKICVVALELLRSSSHGRGCILASCSHTDPCHVSPSSAAIHPRNNDSNHILSLSISIILSEKAANQMNKQNCDSSLLLDFPPKRPGHQIIMFEFDFEKWHCPPTSTKEL